MENSTEHTQKCEEIELDILGMNCINCANSITTYLSKLNGIHSVDLNFTSEVAKIDYDTSIMTKSQIVSDIRKLGFDVLEDEDEQKAELQKQKNLRIQKIKIITSVILSVIVVAVSMREHSSIFSFIKLSQDFALPLLFVLSSVVVFFCGAKFLKGAFNAVRNKNSDMNTLISVGVLSSYIYSIVISANHIFRLNIEALSSSHEVYYESTVMIITFILFGNYLESVLKSKTQTSIKKLKGLQAKFVTVIRGDEEISIPYKKVKKDDIVIIRSGDKIPVDGKIIEGNCITDESAMTGESMPLEKFAGDELISGTILKNGYVKLKAEKVGNETMLSRIIHLVNEASNSKPQIQRLADKIAAIFVPVVLLIALITFAVWDFIIGVPFSNSLLYAVSVLVIACPCALGLASPMAVVIGVGRAAENGILFNKVEAIEKLNKIDTICFDKTGTLTTGLLKVKEIRYTGNESEKDILSYVLSVERFSNHPVAKSLTFFCISNDIQAIDKVEHLMNKDGMGIGAVVNNKKIFIGNEKLLIKNNILIPEGMKSDEANHLFICIDEKVSAVVEFEDTTKEEAPEVVNSLLQKGYKLFMISGDNKHAAESTARKLGISDFSYKTLPEEKEKIISGLQSENRNVAMIGDGINDAPSLSRANVGIAVGTGQDIAIESADVILVKGDLRVLIKSINISSKTVSIIKQNIFWAFFYNILAIPLAAGVLSPFGIIISPVMAAMFMALSDVITVIGNSLRLKYVNIN